MSMPPGSGDISHTAGNLYCVSFQGQIIKKSKKKLYTQNSNNEGVLQEL